MGAAVLLAAAPAPANGVIPAEAIECRLHVPAQVKAGTPVALRFELVSHSSRRLRILNWNTPLEGWFGNYLRVTLGDRELPYQGPQFKRGAPESGDYMTLAPGRNLQAEVDLARAYPVSVPGRYRVVFIGWLHDVTASRPTSARTPYFLQCPAVEFEVLR